MNIGIHFIICRARNVYIPYGENPSKGDFYILESPTSGLKIFRRGERVREREIQAMGAVP